MIIDASVAFKWIVPEDDSDAAMTLIGSGLLAPSLILSEVGNAIGKRVRKREVAWTATLSDDLARLPKLVTLYDEPNALGVRSRLRMNCGMRFTIACILRSLKCSMMCW